MSSRDLEKEMSKFEAELTKLTSSTFASHSTPSTAQAKPKISIQMPTSFSSQLVNQQPHQVAYGQSVPLPPQPRPVPAFNAPSIQRANQSASNGGAGGVKRDASGKILSGQSSRPNFSSASDTASAVATTSVDEVKGKKANGSKDKSANPNNKQKNKKMLRSAGGQVWEDHSLTDWDTGILTFIGSNFEYF